MTTKTTLLAAAAVLTIVAAIPAMAAEVQAVTTKTSTVNPDGSVSYESHTVEKKVPAGTVAVVPATTVAVTSATPVVTFYYYDPKISRIISAGDLNNNVIAIWDENNNNVIDNHEFYNNKLVVYEPMEYTKRTYMDIDGNGVPELTKEEYTMRLEQLPMYAQLNKDNKEGLTLFEFTGVGFQDADINNDNQVDYDELRKAFYAHIGVAPKPEKINN